MRPRSVRPILAGPAAEYPREVSIQSTIGHVDSEAKNPSVAGLHRRLVDMGLLRDGAVEECDIVFCEWPRYEHFRQLRIDRGLSFRLNQIPTATEHLQHKKRFARLLKNKPYALETHLESRFRRLQGVWVEKPYNVDFGKGISFLRDPRRWRRKKHLLQRYVDDPWLVDGRKTEVRVDALLRDDGSVRVHREGMVRLASRPYTIDDLDPQIHNANATFQERMGVTDLHQHLLSDLAPDGTLLDRMVEIVRDTVDVLRSKGVFGGSGDFELLGYDFVVDRAGTPFLIEANRFPGLGFDAEARRRFNSGMLEALYSDI